MTSLETPPLVVDPAEVPSDLHIAGEWRCSETSDRISVFNPATEECISTVADATVSDGIAAVDAAARAARDWAGRQPRERAEILRECYELMMSRLEWLAQLIVLENGKALRDARSEVAYAAEFFRWFSEEAVRAKGEFGRSPTAGSRIIVQYEPIGVSVLITPWNFPAAMATRKIAPALAAGCTCVLKPATETPLTAYAIAALLAEAGVPSGVVNVITTSRSGAVVRAMLKHPRVRKLSFTGSTEVGRLLLQEASATIISCSMELGGNAPFIVLDDADLEAAVEGAMIAKMRNGGEACTAANRFYVQSGVYESFVTAFGERMAALKVGPGIQSSTDCGPLINEKSKKNVKMLVAEALGGGARVEAAAINSQTKGYFVPPMVLAQVPPGAKLLREEIFGPVAPIVRIETAEEAIECANDTEYGLVGYLYTKDLAKGLRLAEKLECGMIALNRGLVSDPAAPFGGVKQSGLGREGSHDGLLEFVEKKYISAVW